MPCVILLCSIINENRGLIEHRDYCFITSCLLLIISNGSRLMNTSEKVFLLSQMCLHEITLILLWIMGCLKTILMKETKDHDS